MAPAPLLISKRSGDDESFAAPSAGAIALFATSLCAAVICLPTFAWHWRGRRSASSGGGDAGSRGHAMTIAPWLVVAWIILFNVLNAVNVSLWPGDVAHGYNGAGLCDVQVRLDVAGQMGLLGAVAAIMRALAAALDTRRAAVAPSAAQRRGRLSLELLLCAGLPLYVACAQLALQPKRYYVVAVAGCVPAFTEGWLPLLLVHLWMPAVALLAAGYAGLVLFRLWRYRARYGAVLAAAGSGLSRARFARLLLNAGLVLLVALPVQLVVLWQNVTAGGAGGASAAGDHPAATWGSGLPTDPARWQRIEFVPTRGAVQPDRWFRPALGLVVFACFGSSPEARALYRRLLVAVGVEKLLGKLSTTLRGSSTTASSGHGSTTSSGSRLSVLKAKVRGSFKAKDAASSRASDATGLTASPSPTRTEFGLLGMPTTLAAAPNPQPPASSAGSTATIPQSGAHLDAMVHELVEREKTHAAEKGESPLGDDEAQCRARRQVAEAARAQLRRAVDGDEEGGLCRDEEAV